MTLRGYPLALVGYAIFLLLMCLRLPYDASLFVLTLSVILGFSALEYSHLKAGRLQHLAVALFVGISLLCAYFARDKQTSFLVLVPLIPAIMGYVTLAAFAKSARNRELILLTVLVLGLALAGWILWQRLSLVTGHTLAYIRQANSPLLVVPNDSIILSLITVLSLSLWSKGQTLVRVLILCLIAASLAATILLASRQGTGLLLGGIGLWALLTSARRLLPLVLAAGLFALAVDALMGWPLLGRVNVFSRAYVWYSGWLMFLDYQWFGVGPGNFKEYYFYYLNKAGYELLALPDHRKMPWVHNLYIEQLAERGLVGLFALLAFFSALACGLWRLWHSPARQTARGYVVALTVAAIVFAVAAVNELTFQRLWVVIFMFLIAGLIVAATDPESDLQRS